MRVRPQGRQHIHIAFSPKVIPQSRAKQLQPGDAAFAAKPPQSFGIEIQLHAILLASSADGVKTRRTDPCVIHEPFVRT